MKAGAQIYADQCSGCHTPKGEGVAGLFPALNGISGGPTSRSDHATPRRAARRA